MSLTLLALVRDIDNPSPIHFQANANPVILPHIPVNFFQAGNNFSKGDLSPKQVKDKGMAQLKSPNFGFLSKHDQMLVHVAALAERFVFEDPNTALMKLRQFAEMLAKHTMTESGLHVTEDDGFMDMLESLRYNRVLTEKVTQLFHELRKTGNKAVHEVTGTQREALHQLHMAWALAVWFHRSFKAPKFRPTFIPPPDPKLKDQAEQEEAEALKEELARLRELSQKALADTQAAQAAANEHEQSAEEIEAEALKAYEELDAAMELAAEAEAKLAEEREAYEARIAEMQAQIEAANKEELHQQLEKTVAAASKASEQVELDEAATRHIIDNQLREAGWEVDSQTLRYAKGTRPQKNKNRAIAEWPTKSGPADYVLFIGLKPVAIIEAKKQTLNCQGAIEQAKRYSRDIDFDQSLTPGGPWGDYRVPFLFASNGRPYLRQMLESTGVHFLDVRRTANLPHILEAWYTPDGLEGLLKQDIDAADTKLEDESADYLPLYPYQRQAVNAIEKAIIHGDRELLLAMATGTGKTRTCIALIYRLLKAERFRRVLFLVDRSALGNQTLDSLKDVRLEKQQTFADVYDVKELGDIKPDKDTRLHIATVQGMVKRLLYADDSLPPVPVDAYDCVIIDECHRGYNMDQEMSDSELIFRSEADYISKYRRVVDHFDAVRIGLTATPALHTTEIFGKPVFEYSYRQAVVDGYLIDHEPPSRIVTKLSRDGITWEKGDVVKMINVRTGEVELNEAPDEVQVEIDGFNRQAITENFNKVVCEALAKQIDPAEPGKTLIFCVNDKHADTVVRLLRAAFEAVYGDVHHDTVLKITGRTDKPLEMIRRYRNEQLPKVGVTVDLLTTGVDVPAITNLVFIRRVKSRILFDQMLGRATRRCADLYGPGEDKENFYIYDAVDIYSSLEEMTNMRPVVNQVNISFKQLAEELTRLTDSEALEHVKDQMLAKLHRKKLSDRAKEHLQVQTGMDRQQLIEHIKSQSPEELGAWFSGNNFVAELLDEKADGKSHIFISEHEDELIGIERGYGDNKKPQDYLDSFREYIESHLQDFPALIVVTQRPRDLTRQQLKELRLELDKAGFTEANLQSAYRDVTNKNIAAAIMGYILHVACEQPLIPHSARVQSAMDKVMSAKQWSRPQRRWLERIGKQLEREYIVDPESMNEGQFKQEGGFKRVDKIFDGELEEILKELTAAMWVAA